MSDFWAVAERFGDEGWRAFEDEFFEGSVPGPEEVDAEVAESVHDGVRVQVLAYESAGEEPWILGARAGAEVRPCSEVLPYERRERFGNIGRICAEGDAHAGIVVVDRARRKGDDPNEWLGTEEQECAGDSVGERFAGAGEKLADPGETLVLAEGPAGLG